jgi:hypothetical protein
MTTTMVWPALKATGLQILSTLIGADGGDATSPVTTWRREPDAVRPASVRWASLAPRC